MQLEKNSLKVFRSWGSSPMCSSSQTAPSEERWKTVSNRVTQSNSSTHSLCFFVCLFNVKGQNCVWNQSKTSLVTKYDSWFCPQRLFHTHTHTHNFAVHTVVAFRASETQQIKSWHNWWNTTKIIQAWLKYLNATWQTVWLENREWKSGECFLKSATSAVHIHKHTGPISGLNTHSHRYLSIWPYRGGGGGGVRAEREHWSPAARLWLRARPNSQVVQRTTYI